VRNVTQRMAGHQITFKNVINISLIKRSFCVRQE
jgi:hypothetical protein